MLKKYSLHHSIFGSSEGGISRCIMRKPKSSGKTTAELLKEAAISLFGQYGYEGTSVRLIAIACRRNCRADHGEFRQQGESF